MSRRLGAQTLVLATHNSGKVDELKHLLATFGVEHRLGSAIGLLPPLEDGSSYEANARIKALAASRTTGLPALADDTGLGVDALNGEPGVHTRRVAEEHGGWDRAHVWLRDALAERGIALERTPCAARFHCVLTLAWPDGWSRSYEGVWEGRVSWPPTGGGPGFVPMFRGEEGGLPTRASHVLPHRARAFARLAAHHLS